MSKCNYSYWDDEDDIDEVCDSNDSGYFSCNHGRVCENHKCRCKQPDKDNPMSTSDVSRDVKHINDIGFETTMRGGLTKEKAVIYPGNMNLSLIGTDSIKIAKGPDGTAIEVKTVDGEWFKLNGVQSIKVEIDVDSPAPKITIERYLL